MSQTTVVRITLTERAHVSEVVGWLDAQLDQNYAPPGVESTRSDIHGTAQAGHVSRSPSPGHIPTSNPTTFPPEVLQVLAHIAIEVRSGTVQAIRSNDPDVRVTLINWDRSSAPGADLPVWALDDQGDAISADVFPYALYPTSGQGERTTGRAIRLGNLEAPPDDGHR